MGNDIISAKGTLYVHLTEEQYQKALANGTLGRGFLGSLLDEGRIWATPYSQQELQGIGGFLRKLSFGLNPFTKRSYAVEISGEAAAAFKLPFGPEFSWNAWGWTKGLLGNQYQFRGTLPFSGGPITSLAGANGYSAAQMAFYRFGELTRFGVLSGLMAFGSKSGDR